MNKNILFINDEVELYGAEISLLEMANALSHFTPIVLLPKEGPLQNSLNKKNVKVIIHEFPTAKKSLKDRLCLVLILKNVLEEYKINLLHLNKATTFLIEARIASWIKGIPMVVHLRERYWPSILEKIVLSKANMIICVSNYCREYLLQHRRSDFFSKIDKDNSTVIYDGKKLENFYFSNEIRDKTRTEFGVDEKEILIALVGYFNPNKGQDRFVELARELLYCDNRMKFIIIGDILNAKYKDFKDKVLRLIEEYRLKDKFILPGYIDIIKILSGIDILVNLSEYEGLCHSVIEAMAAERTVVVNATGGIPEVVGDERAGFLVNGNNIQKMKEIILMLISNKRLRELTGTKARERVNKLFDAEKQNTKIEEVYRSVLSN